MDKYKLLTDTPLSETIATVDAIVEAAKRNIAPTQAGEDFLNQVVRAVEQLFLREIRARQARIEGLDTGALGYQAVWGGKLTPGCQHCIDRGFNAIRASSTCSLRCQFCYYGMDKEEVGRILPGYFGVGEHIVSERDVKLMVSKIRSGRDRIDAIAWVFMEPFEELDKHPALISYIHEQGLHQHLYTNGTLCTRDNMKVLADAGLNELRFNLAASKCSDKVIEAMRIARDLFEYVCIESPMHPEYYERFVAKRKAILATGVDHIHCAELHLTRHNYEPYRNDPDLYRYGDGYLSPMWSRRLTYDMLDLAAAERWENVAIHDCSNEVKLLRGVSTEVFGMIEYEKEVSGLPLWWFRAAARKYDFTTLAGAVPSLACGQPKSRSEGQSQARPSSAVALHGPLGTW